MKNKALQDYYTTLAFKDNSGAKYYFDVNAIDARGISFPVVSIHQNGKNATGAETFKKAIEQIEKNKSCIKVKITEYNTFIDNPQPVNEVTYKIVEKKKEDDQPQPQTQMQRQNFSPFMGFGNTEQTNSFLNGLDAQMNILGIQGGLQGLIQSTATQLTLQDRYDDLKQLYADTKMLNKEQEKEIKDLKQKLEEKHESYKKLEYQLMDAQRENKEIERTYQSKLSMGSLISNAVMNTAVNKFGGLLGLDDIVQQAQQAAPAQENPVSVSTENISLQQTNPETEKYISDINDYLNTLDLSRIQCMYAIAMYASQGDDQLKELTKYVKSKQS